MKSTKAFWTLFSVLLVSLAVIFPACDTGGGNKTPGTIPGGADIDNLYDPLWVKQGEAKDLMTLDIASLKPTPPYDTDRSYSASLKKGVMSFGDNFKYGDGWQVKIPWAANIGAAPKIGDVYELAIKFTVNKDLEDDLQWVIVDDAPAAGPGTGYWGEMCRWKSVNVPEAEEEPLEEGTGPAVANPVKKGELTPKEPVEGKGYPVGTWFKKDTEYEYVGRVLVTHEWKAGGTPNLCFGTGAAGLSGGEDGDSTPTNGATDPTVPVITFSKFEVTKYNWEGETEGDGDGDEEGDGE